LSVVPLLIFRDLCPGEETAACDLVIDCFDRFIAPGYSPEGIAEFHKFVTPEAISDRVTKGHFILVAAAGGSIVGVLDMRSNNHVSMLFVKPEFHRRGISKRLLCEALRRCAVADPNITSIDVNSSPYAVAIYEKLGFVKTGEERMVNGIRFTPMRSDLDRSLKADS